MPKFPYEDVDFGSMARKYNTKPDTQLGPKKQGFDWNSAFSSIAQLGSAVAGAVVSTKRMNQQRTIDSISRAMHMAGLGVKLPPELVSQLPAGYSEALGQESDLMQRKREAEIEHLGHHPLHHVKSDVSFQNGKYIETHTFADDYGNLTTKNQDVSGEPLAVIQQKQRIAAQEGGLTKQERDALSTAKTAILKAYGDTWDGSKYTKPYSSVAADYILKNKKLTPAVIDILDNLAVPLGSEPLTPTVNLMTGVKHHI